ncbi:MFS transporter [Deinococcus irradiatisoli]|uniref:MFS transporter n=1 Tax=Deinococcus irradiatisoli TaxID=2202254 RepID=A0A2Z3JF34_9DEIO|nr:MDR family MFS transporter [Deinococcus irradiatisoli]AWN23575.1 MFS transporter [Deinococcus irradiatisoli]
MTQTAPPPNSTNPEDRINYAEVLPHRTKIVILFGTLLSLFLAALDQTIVSTSLPRIIADLNGLNLYSWVTTAYLLASTAMVPIYGKLSDIYGRKPVLLFGITVFLIGSALCGLSGEAFLGNLFGSPMLQLVVFRGLQGFGAAALTSVAFSIIADIFVPAERGRYQGLFGAVFGLSSVIGPLLGGFLTDQISWRWVFYVNLPIGLIAIAFILSKMPRLASGLKPKIDYLGAILVVTFSTPLLLALTFGAEPAYGWTDPRVLWLFAGAALSLVLFLYVESRHESPILPLSLFKNPTFAWGVLARFFIGAAFLGAILFLSLYLVNVQGVSATKAGTATIPLTMGLIFGSILSGQLASRLGVYKPMILVGLVLMMGGFYLLSTLNADTAYGTVIVYMVVLGVGIGPALPLFNLAIQNAVQRWEIGVATSSGQFFQQMGSTIGTAVFGAVLTSGLSSELNTQLAPIKADAPPAIRAQLDAMSKTSSGGGAGRSSFDAGDAKAKADAAIRQGFDDTRALFTRAFRDNDPAALKQLQQSESLPDSFKTQLAAGTPAQQVQSAFNGIYQSIAAAVNSGSAAAVQQIAADPKLPAPLRTQLSTIPPQALANAAARTQILSGIKKGLDAAAAQAGTQAGDQALTGALKGLDTAEQQALAQTNTTLDKVGRAIKVSFANTISHIYLISIFVALLALLSTLPMPNLRLPKKGEGQGGPSGEQRGGLASMEG